MVIGKNQRKAKPPVRVGRKATGLAGEAPELPRFTIRVFLDGRVAELNGNPAFLLVWEKTDDITRPPGIRGQGGELPWGNGS